MKTDALGLYIHIPFCVRKCAYCDFLSAPAEEETREAYVDVLLRELAGTKEMLSGGNAVFLDSVYIGGGTPTCLTAGQLSRIFETIMAHFSLTADAEITVEANPGTVTPDHAEALRGFANRVSLGLQSADEMELAALGRIHRFKEYEQSAALLAKTGITNRNVDLMCGIPHQTMQSLTETLKQVFRTEPSHVSLYSLIVEEGTPFSEMQHAGALPVPPEEDVIALEETARQILAEHGFLRYEISNYAKCGMESRHNVRYWTGGPYIGTGLGAASFRDGFRYRNITDLKAYLASGGSPAVLRCEEHWLTVQERQEEFFFLGLRLLRGVSKAEFADRFGQTAEAVYGGQLQKLTAQGLLQEDEEKGRIFLTKRGLELGNQVFAAFLQD